MSFIFRLKRLLSKKPESYSIETTTKCNFNCAKCCRRLKPVQERDMPLWLLRDILEKIGHVKELIPFGRGEPLIHSRILEVVRLCSRHADYVHINTNGSLLNRVIARGLVNAGLSELTLSLDHLENQQVLHNLHEVAATPGLNLSIHSVFSKQNEEYISELPVFAAQEGIGKITFNIIKLWPDRLPSHPRETLESLQDECAQLGLETNIKALKHETEYVNLCLAPFKTMNIDVEGNVTACCNLPHLIMGNFLNNEYEKPWLNFRKAVARKKLPEWCTSRCLISRRALLK